MVFGRKQVDHHGHVSWESLLAAYRMTQTTNIETREETRDRLRIMVSLEESGTAAFVENYNERIRRAEHRLELAMQPMRQYLFRTGITWSVEPSYLLAPEMWSGGQLVNTLIYGLGLTPHDTWNRLVMVDNPVAAVDLGVRVYDRDEARRRTREFEEAQVAPLATFARLENIAKERGDIESLVAFVCDWRDRLDVEFAIMRAEA